MSVNPETATSFEVEGSNAKISSNGESLRFDFPADDGVLTTRRFEFRDRDDLVNYLSETFLVPVVNGGVRVRITRRGKYARRDENGNQIYTIGDPTLDMVTNENGELIIAGHRVQIARNHLQDRKLRPRGIGAIDLTSFGNDLARVKSQRAVVGESDDVLIRSSDGITTLASRSADTWETHMDGDTLQFHAWKSGRGWDLKWTMGAEIETWGQDFTRARIDSRYLDTYVAQTCAAVKFDSDEDTNDDYVDEYEEGWNAPQPLRVVSQCTAEWKGSTWTAEVSAGTPCYEVNP
jgi:hypothetical protein